MVKDSLPKGKNIPIICFNHSPPAGMTTLLHQHTYRAHYAGVGGPVTGVEKIKSFTGVIHDLMFIKSCDICQPKSIRKSFIGLRQHEIAWRRAGHGEIISVKSHLMIIYMDLWEPFLIGRNSPFGFRVNHPNPITIQIEPIMIGPSAGPWFIMFIIKLICVGHIALCRFIPIHIPIPPIRIDAGDQDHNGIIQNRFGLFISTCGQPVGDLHDRLSTGCLIAMDIITEPVDARVFPNNLLCHSRINTPRIGQALIILLNIIQSISIFSTRDHKVFQITPFMGFAIRMNRNAIRFFTQGS